MANIAYTVTYQNSLLLTNAEEQEYVIRKRLNNLSIQKVFTDRDIDNTSLFDREQFKIVMKELETGKYKKLIIYSIMSLGTNREEFNKCINKLKKWNVILQAIDLSAENLHLMGILAYGILNYAGTTYIKLFEKNYRIYTGKIDNARSVKYKGNIADLNFIDYWLLNNKDNYLQIITFDTFEIHFDYLSETTLGEDINKIKSLLTSKKSRIEPAELLPIEDNTNCKEYGELSMPIW